jgi:hypothetical protein
MPRLAWLGGLCGLAAIALLVVLRGQAAANETATCVPAEGFLPSFCLNVPMTGLRHETTVPLVSLPSQRADVRVEVSVPGSDAAALSASVDRSVGRVEALFGRTFSARPRVLLFGTSDSFATGAGDLFGYSRKTASYVASTYGGIFDRPTLTIAVNWSSAGSARMGAAIEHELVHLMIREVTNGADIPVWLDEGIATLVEENAPGASAWSEDEALIGRAVAVSGGVSLDSIKTLAGFHASYARLGRPLYAFSADLVGAMEERIGWDGIAAVLAGAGRGERADTAYARIAGEGLAALQQRLAQTGPAIAVSAAMDASGNRAWTLFAGAANSAVRVSISGGAAYSVTFTVTTDGLGMYRGSFGSTAAPGTYTVRAAGAQATIDTAR